MPSTPLAGLPYPAGTDSFDPGRDFQSLAEAGEGQLFRAYPCTAFPSGVGAGFLAYRTDEDKLYRYSGSSWAAVSNSVVGGGGGGTSTISTVWAGWQAASAQPIATGADVTIAFGTALAGNDSGITRATSGAGHSFTLGATRVWQISLTARFAQNAVGGRTFELRAGSTVLAKASGPVNTDAPYSANLAVARRFPAGTVITAVARHNSSTSVALEHDGGQYVHIDFAGI